MLFGRSLRVRFNRRAYLALTIANLKVYLRNPLGASSVFVGLMFLLVLVRSINVSEPSRIKIGVIDQTRTPAASRLIAALKTSSELQVTVFSEGDARQVLDASKSDLVFGIPPEMGTTDSSGALRSATVSAVFHAGSPGQGTVGSLRLIVADLNQQLLGADPVVRLRSSALETATTSANVGNFFLPGIVAFNLIQSGLLST